MFGKTLDEFSASLVRESVGKTYAQIRCNRLNGMAFLLWFGWHDVLRRY